MRVKVVRVAAPTVTGTLDFTVAGAGTCIGAKFWMNVATADNTPVNGARHGNGATDGTNQWAMAASSQNGQMNTNTAKLGMTDKCICLIQPTGAIDGEAGFDSFITDGIRINVTDAFPAADLITAELYFNDDGANDDFHVGTFDTSSADVDVTAPGFAPTYVEVATIRGAFDDTAILTESSFSIGWAHNSGANPPPQVSMNFGETDGVSEGAPRMRIESALVCADHSAAALLGQVQITTFDASGFTAVRTNGAGYACGYVAVKCRNAVDLRLNSTPTGTGANSYTAAGIFPQAVLGFMSRMSATESTDQTGLAGSYGVFCFTDAATEFCNSVAIEDLSATTDTQSLCDSIFFNLPDHDGGTTDDIVASITSILATGFEATFTSVASSARLFGALTIGLTPTVVSPTAGTATFNGVDPAIVLSSMSVTPTAASASFLGVDPTAVLGGMTVVPTAGSVLFDARSAIVVFGSILIGPAAAAASFLGVDPSLFFNSTAVSPVAAVATFNAVNPSLGLSSMAVTPTAGSALFLGSDPFIVSSAPVVVATMTAHDARTGFNYLQGMLPVPDSWTETRLVLRDPNTGLHIPTEQIVAERGPLGNPRILEIRAYGSIPSGAPTTYDVEEGEKLSALSFHDDITVNIESDAPNSKTDQNTILTFSSRLMLAGASTGTIGDVTRTVRKAGELQASSGSRLYGYEAFITTIAGEPDVWLIEMTVQNGTVGNPGAGLGANVLHDVFFNEIRLVPFVGATPSTDYAILPLHATPYLVNGTRKLMEPNGDGSDHVIQLGQAHEYRFALYHTSKLARASALMGMFGFLMVDHSKEKWSWSNRETAWFGPEGTFVANTSVASHFPFQVQWTGASALKAAINNGNPIVIDGEATSPSTVMGPYHARGKTDAGPTGGVGIFGYVGHEVVNTGVGIVDRLNTLIAIQGMDRDRQAGKQASGGNAEGICFVDNSQNAIDPSQWDLSSCESPGPGFINTSLSGPFPRHLADNWRYLKSQSSGKLPSYYGTLTNFHPHSYSHMIRGMNATLPLIYLRNDPLAKSYAAQLAAWARIRNNEYGQGDLWKNWAVDSQPVSTFPGKGIGSFGGRYSAWASMIMAVDYQFGSDTKRTNYGNFVSLYIEIHEEGQFPYPGSGNWHAAGTFDTPSSYLDTQWTQNGHAGSVDAAAADAIEIGMHARGLNSWRNAIDNASILSMLSNACRGLYDYHWLPGFGAPSFAVPVRPETTKALPAWTTRYPGTGDPNGTLGGIAPDCFTKPPFQSPDNYQISSLILAALKSDPGHVQAWQAIYDMTGTSTIADAIADINAVKASDYVKWISGWNAVQGFLEDAQFNTSVVPTAGVATFTGTSPSIGLSSMVVVPAAGAATFNGVDPTITDGSRITVDPAIATFNGVDPSATLGSVTAIPVAGTATFSAVAPSVGLGSVSVTPTAGLVEFAALDPTVTDGGRLVPLEPAVAEFLGVDPTVTLSSVASIPEAGTATFAGVDPTVVFNSLVLTPEAGVVTFLAEAPDPEPPIIVTPGAGVATFLAVDPGVIDTDAALVSSTITLMGNISTVLATLRGRA